MQVVDFDTKTITADNHVLETYRTCEEKYRLGLHEHWRPAEAAAALGFGIAMHEARATYKKLTMQSALNQLVIDRLVSLADYAIEKGLNTWDAEMPPEMKTEVMQDNKRSRRNFERLARGYFEKFGGDDFQSIRVEIPGKKFLGTTPEGWTMNYVYTIDEVVKHRDKVYPLEFKTMSGFSPPDPRFFSQFSNKASITGYIWATEQELGVDIPGAIIHAMWVQAEPKGKSKYALADYFRMDYTYRDDDQIEEWKRNTLLTGDDIVRSVQENRWKRNDGVACSMYNGCSFKKICEATPEIRSKLLEIGYEKKEWSPWARIDGEVE